MSKASNGERKLLSEEMFFEDFSVGQAFASRGRTVMDADIRLFIGATGADHPNHTDAEYCRNHPIFRRTCAPGVLVLSLTDGFIAEAITRKTALSLNYGHDKIRYLRPVYPEDTIHAEMEILASEERDPDWGLLTVEARAKNQKGDVVLINVNKLLIQRRGSGLKRRSESGRPNSEE